MWVSGQIRLSPPTVPENRNNKTGNVHITVRCIRVTAVAIEEQFISHIVCVCVSVLFSYPLCKARALYYIVICGPLWLYHICPHYLINGMIFEKSY